MLGRRMGIGNNLITFEHKNANLKPDTVNQWITTAERWVNKIKGRLKSQKYVSGDDRWEEIQEATLELAYRIANNVFITLKIWGKDSKNPPYFPMIESNIRTLLDGTDNKFNEFQLGFGLYVR